MCQERFWELAILLFHKFLKSGNSQFLSNVDDGCNHMGFRLQNRFFIPDFCDRVKQTVSLYEIEHYLAVLLCESDYSCFPMKTTFFKVLYKNIDVYLKYFWCLVLLGICRLGSFILDSRRSKDKDWMEQLWLKIEAKNFQSLHCIDWWHSKYLFPIFAVLCDEVIKAKLKIQHFVLCFSHT